GRTLVGEALVHLAHGARAAIPQDPENGQLGVGRTRRGRLGHETAVSTTIFVVSTKTFVEEIRAGFSVAVSVWEDTWQLTQSSRPPRAISRSGCSSKKPPIRLRISSAWPKAP